MLIIRLELRPLFQDIQVFLLIHLQPTQKQYSRIMKIQSLHIFAKYQGHCMKY